RPVSAAFIKPSLKLVPPNLIYKTSMNNDLSGLSATALLEGYANHRFSPVEVVQQSLQLIAATQPDLNAFCLVDAEMGLSMARASEKRWMQGTPQGLLDGIP